MKLKLAFAIFLGFILSSCATIVGEKFETVQINSNPSDAEYTIIDRNSNSVVKRGFTPDSVQLPKASGFYSSIQYAIIFSKAGYNSETINLSTKLTGSVFGNFISWGILGFLVDGINSDKIFKIVPNNVKAQLTK